MFCIPLTQTGGRFTLAKEETQVKDTAWYIFKDEAALSYSIDNASLKAATGMLSVPIVTNGSDRDLNRIAANMVRIRGPIWEMAERFIGGATLAFPEPGVATTVYRRICDHIDKHYFLMRNDGTYTPPDEEDFRMLAEFAEGIRSIALSENPDLEKPITPTMRKTLYVRPSFSDDEPVGQQVEEPRKVSQITEKMDAVNRFLEMYGDGY